MEYEIEAEESVSMAVIRAVSAVEGCDPCSLQPLAAVVDPDALNELFKPLGNGTPRVGGRFSFVYSECRVTVDNGEYLTIQPFGALSRVRRDDGLGRRDASAGR